MVNLRLTVYFVYSLHFGFIIKIFPDKATARKNAKQSK